MESDGDSQCQTEGNADTGAHTHHYAHAGAVSRRDTTTDHYSNLGTDAYHHRDWDGNSDPGSPPYEMRQKWPPDAPSALRRFPQLPIPVNIDGSVVARIVENPDSCEVDP